MGASKKQEFRRGRCSLVVLRSALTRATRRRRAAGEIVWKFSNLTASLPGRISFASTMLDTIYDVTGAPEACQIQNWDGGGEGTVTPALKVFFFFLVGRKQATHRAQECSDGRAQNNHHDNQRLLVWLCGATREH